MLLDAAFGLEAFAMTGQVISDLLEAEKKRATSH